MTNTFIGWFPGKYVLCDRVNPSEKGYPSDTDKVFKGAKIANEAIKRMIKENQNDKPNT